MQHSAWLMVLAAAGALTLAVHTPRTDVEPLADEAQPTGDTPWHDVLGPPQGAWPAPQERIVWREDLAEAFAEARATNRPLFVTLRCLPCKQCAEFDASVLDGGSKLDPLLKQLITVRLTSMRNVDARLLPYERFQDLDLSWWGYLLSPEGRLYAIYGGRDEVSDKSRISIESLQSTLQRVLDHHHDPRRAAWNVDGPLPLLDDEPRTPVQLAGWKSWAKRGAEEAKTNECLHCHQVAEIIRQPAADGAGIDRAADFDVWPFPENVGLRLDRDHGLRVAEVFPDGAAAVAGVEPGDELGAAAGRKLFGQADLRGVLHRAPAGDTEVELRWSRDGVGQVAKLALNGRWKRTNLGWRKSVAEAAVGAHPGFPWPLGVNDGERRKRGIEANTLAVRPWFGPKGAHGLAAKAGLRGNDVIVAVNGQSPNVAARPFMVWFRLNFDPDDEVTLTVVNAEGRRRELIYRVNPSE